MHSPKLLSPLDDDYGTVELGIERDRLRTLRCGRRNLRLVKLTGSAFKDFARDAYTTLPERQDRPLFIHLDVHWRYRRIEDGISDGPARIASEGEDRIDGESRRDSSDRHGFKAGALNAVTQTLCWTVIFYFASAGASAGYLTVSEIFPLEVRAKAIAVFFAIAQCFGSLGSHLYGRLIGTGKDPNSLYWGYLLGAGAMILGGVVAALHVFQELLVVGPQHGHGVPQHGLGHVAHPERLPRRLADGERRLIQKPVVQVPGLERVVGPLLLGHQRADRARGHGPEGQEDGADRHVEQGVRVRDLAGGVARGVPHQRRQRMDEREHEGDAQHLEADVRHGDATRVGGCAQARRQRGAPELRHAPRTGIAADVRHRLDGVLGKQVEKFPFGASGVSDSPDAEIHARETPRTFYRGKKRLSSRRTARLLMPRVTSAWNFPFTPIFDPVGGGSPR